MGATPNAHLSDIGKAETSQYIQIVAVDYNNNIIFEQDAKVQLQGVEMNRKLLFKIGGLAALVAPIATVVSCGTTTSANAVDAKQDTTNRAAAATSSATASTGFNQYQPKDFDIDKKDATDFRAIETYQGEVDMSV